jgi:hypothetical protein
MPIGFFRLFVEDKQLIDADSEVYVRQTILQCAVACVLLANCKMFNFLAYEDNSTCQLSHGEANCMENADLLKMPGYRMFERKVRPHQFYWIAGTFPNVIAGMKWPGTMC